LFTFSAPNYLPNSLLNFGYKTLNHPVYELLKGVILNLIKGTYFLVGKKKYYIVAYCILETPGSIVQRAHSIWMEHIQMKGHALNLNCIPQENECHELMDDN
jgi:hypothetical protein